MNGAGKDNVSISQTNDVNSTGGNSGLKKVMSFPMVILTIINMVIGSGIFFKAQGVFTITGGAPGIGIAAWIAAGLLSLLGGLTVAELAGAIPKTGGMVTWLEEIFGKRVGFLTGWVEAVVFWPANIGALGSVFAVQMANLFGWGGKCSSYCCDCCNSISYVYELSRCKSRRLDRLSYDNSQDSSDHFDYYICFYFYRRRCWASYAVC